MDHDLCRATGHKFAGTSTHARCQECGTTYRTDAQGRRHYTYAHGYLLPQREPKPVDDIQRALEEQEAINSCLAAMQKREVDA